LLNIPRSKEAHVLVRKAAIRRTWTAPNGKERQKAPKIQRLITEQRLRRKKIYKVISFEGNKYSFIFLMKKIILF
jgi:hypothetical protein